MTIVSCCTCCCFLLFKRFFELPPKIVYMPRCSLWNYLRYNEQKPDRSVTFAFYSSHAVSKPYDFTVTLRGKTKHLKKQESSSLLFSCKAIPVSAAKLQIYFENSFFNHGFLRNCQNKKSNCYIMELMHPLETNRKKPTP